MVLRNGLSLGGAPGVGKTCILSLVAWVARQYEVVYTKAPRCYARLRRHWEHEEFVLAARHCDLLLIDDLGTEAADNEAQAQFHDLLDERTGNRRATWITTNLFEEEIAKRPDLIRVIDRLRVLNDWLEADETESQRTQTNWRDWEVDGQ